MTNFIESFFNPIPVGRGGGGCYTGIELKLLNHPYGYVMHNSVHPVRLNHRGKEDLNHVERGKRSGKGDGGG